MKRLNIGIATSLLGWIPKVGPDESFATTIDYFRRLVANGGD